MPVIRRRGLGDQPRLVQHGDDLIRKRALLQIAEIALELGEAADANDDAVVPAILDVERRVVHEPSQRRLEQREAMLLDDGLDQPQRLERRVLEVPVAVVLARGVLVAVAALFRDDVLGLVFA